jgi:hypothetical protein
MFALKVVDAGGGWPDRAGYFFGSPLIEHH